MTAGNERARCSEQPDMTQPWRPAPPPMPPSPPRRRGAGFIIGMIAAGIGGVLVLGFAAVACIAIITPSSSTSSAPGVVGPQPGASAPQQAGPVTAFGDGTYRVGPGHDILPGRYRTTGSGQAGILESCYWERNANNSGLLDAIISNDNFNGPASITVSSGEYLKVSGGCLWTKAN